ncbi:unnamed protein product [Rangifer tarandus platyrhynchus]|uniref:Uncharacterized protein n=2 Tax=Rangifer tarandus platyrhynchus TaxID=3082113 RepID=A0ABN8Z823_RANTA|nr:unnamed protein product [Rangifer tarandus platyrhynchus]
MIPSEEGKKYATFHPGGHLTNLVGFQPLPRTQGTEDKTRGSPKVAWKGHLPLSLKSQRASPPLCKGELGINESHPTPISVSCHKKVSQVCDLKPQKLTLSQLLTSEVQNQLALG